MVKATCMHTYMERGMQCLAALSIFLLGVWVEELRVENRGSRVEGQGLRDR